MTKCILNIYNLFKKYPLIGWIAFVVFTTLFVLLVLRLSYKEDISDFLPLDEKNQMALNVYQDISGANKIFAIISMKDDEIDRDLMIETTDYFVDKIVEIDSLHYLNGILKEIDFEKIEEITDYVYDNLPYFLEDTDYERIDSLLSIQGYVNTKLEEDKQMLLFPSSSMIAANIARDPLDLFSPVISRLQQDGLGIDFDNYDGHILTPNGDKVLLIMESSFGSQESENNSKLIDLLNSAKKITENEYKNIDIHFIGGPVIAVGNAERIKADSILAISISGILILILLIYVFRNIWNILLILVSIGWGWLFAMAAISLHYDSISLIVLGITSVILGIAINYPLHLIDHIKSHPNKKLALKEIVSPLIVGNVTTVGAFLCLVPLNSPALHDLGLFSSFLLIGTILFVLIFLPHVVKTRKNLIVDEKINLISRLAELKLENSKYVVYVALILTVLFAIYSFKTEFDSDIRNINYMSSEQQKDMDYFQSLLTSDSDSEELFIASFGDDWENAIIESEKVQNIISPLQDEGLVKRINYSSSFLISEDRQNYKLERWNNLTAKYSYDFRDTLSSAANKVGFNPSAFNSFIEIIDKEYKIESFEYFKDFINEVFQGTLSETNNTGKKTVVSALRIKSSDMEKVKKVLSKHEFGGLFFDVKSMNGSITNSLSDDFNYIGFVCGAIVFIFLWISLGSIELAIISFIPMAISWIWILGFMGMTGIKFNIVNIILATFIFGQGDDYTIFITEGLTYEFAYRKKVLVSYKNSIIVSALIMFFGIGTLLFAKHPAMKSLGEVTVIGMISVVIMAYLFPPLIFNMLIKKKGILRLHPLTIKILWIKLFNPSHLKKLYVNINKVNTVKEAIPWVRGRYLYKGREIEYKARKILRLLEKQSQIIESLTHTTSIYINDTIGQGELAIIIALINPQSTVYCNCYLDESKEILEGCLIDFIQNIKIVNHKPFETVSTLILNKDSLEKYGFD